MDYQKIYDSIIAKAKSLNRKKGDGNYYEQHHIVPKCLGGNNEKENKVLLTAREHYVCHKLLHYIYPNNNKLSFAYHAMINMHKERRKLKLTSREYEEIRTAYSMAISVFHINKTPEEKAAYEAKRKETNDNKSPEEKMETIEKIKKSWENKTQEEKDAVIAKANESRRINYESKTDEEKSIIYNKVQLALSNKSKEEKDNIKMRQSESHKGENNPMYGKSLSRESIEKSIKKRLIVYENKTDEEKNKISKKISIALTGRIYSVETIEKMRSEERRVG